MCRNPLQSGQYIWYKQNIHIRKQSQVFGITDDKIPDAIVISILQVLMSVPFGD
ncbi:hypothetical protein D3C87_1179010 [compost metagenome]